ncbi:MAG: GSU2086 family protein [Planctomycetota bacterium]|jgi:hypothetical protein
MMPFEQFNADKMEILPLGRRENFIDIQAEAIDPDAGCEDSGPIGPRIDVLVDRIVSAKRRGASVMMAYGAHLVKNCLALVVDRLISEGWITHLATQGAGVIHDWEFAFMGTSSESVRDNAPVGRFGSWDETGKAMNLSAIAGGAEGLGFGEALGRMIVEDGWTLPETEVLRQSIREQPDHPLTAARADLLRTMLHFKLPAGRLEIEHGYKGYSITAKAYELGIPLTVHPGIGYDIYTNHPMFHGGAIGRAAGVDARIFAQSVKNLTEGVYISMGSAIMSPQVFEKAFSAANNVRRVEGEALIRDHYIAVVDIQAGGDWNWAEGEPPKDHPAYYLRFCKSFFRMGGTVDYIMGDNRVVLSNLLAKLRERGG